MEPDAVQRWLPKLQTPLIALLLLGMGLYFLYAFGQMDTLRCEQPGPRCTMNATWLNILTLRRQEIGTLRSAQVQSSCESEGCSYRIYLETDRGGTALSSLYTANLQEQQALAEQINNFAGGASQPVLEISTGAGWLLIIPALLLLAGLGMAARGARTLGGFRAFRRPSD